MRIQLTENFPSRVQWKGQLLRIRNAEVPLRAFDILPVGVVICARAVQHDEVASSDLSVAVAWRERLTR